MQVPLRGEDARCRRAAAGGRAAAAHRPGPDGARPGPRAWRVEPARAVLPRPARRRRRRPAPRRRVRRGDVRRAALRVGASWPSQPTGRSARSVATAVPATAIGRGARGAGAARRGGADAAAADGATGAIDRPDPRDDGRTCWPPIAGPRVTTPSAELARRRSPRIARSSTAAARRRQRLVPASAWPRHGSAATDEALAAFDRVSGAPPRPRRRRARGRPGRGRGRARSMRQRTRLTGALETLPATAAGGASWAPRRCSLAPSPPAASAPTRRGPRRRWPSRPRPTCRIAAFIEGRLLHDRTRARRRSTRFDAVVEALGDRPSPFDGLSVVSRRLAWPGSTGTPEALEAFERAIAEAPFDLRGVREPGHAAAGDEPP